ncbi:MAG: amino acid adenylation protein, partial [Solirubrobacteraceae bacterium]
SWFGSPALELPRVPDRADPSRTTDPPARLIAARGVMDVIRIVLPGSVSTAIGSLAFWGLDALGTHVGLLAMLLMTPVMLLGAGIVACLATIEVKWLIIGRYRPGEHPLWSFFVWRDEIMNSCQEQLAGTWLLDAAMATPLMSLYLRLMGAKVGRDVWCETLTITEFELATLGDGCAVNRHAVVETHLFHDRLMRIGPASLGAGATLGPSAAMLPDSKVGAGCSVGGRSVVMRGEELPALTRWHGAPVVAR